MKEYYDVIKDALELVDTIQEGLKKAQNLLLKQKYKDAFFILQESIEGIFAVEHAIKPVLLELKKNEAIEPHSAQLKTSIERLITDYEENGTNTLKILISDLYPSFTQWSNEITKVLSPLYTLLCKMINRFGRESGNLLL